MVIIINLTQHVSTPEQKKADVFDLQRPVGIYLKDENPLGKMN